MLKRYFSAQRPALPLEIGLSALVVMIGVAACRSLPATPVPTITPTEWPTQGATLAITLSSTPIVVPEQTPTPEPFPTPTSDALSNARKRMVETQMQARDITDQRVLAAMEKVPRHEFVPDENLSQAYADHPLPIGYGQTISQPYIVALMTQLLDLKPGDKVLEIGTGSGYQAAVLAEMTDNVYSVEIIPELAARARSTLDALGYDFVVTQQADGYWGWEEFAPFDAIIVTAAPDHVPQPLLAQLADKGRLVIPVGPVGGYQSLWLITREGEKFNNFNWGGVRFVPLTREEE